MTVASWIEAYGRAWEAGDADAAAALFTEDAVYLAHVFREPHVGHEDIRAYWRRATRDQEGTEVRFGEPVVEGRHAAVEWWAVMREGGEEVTLPGCLVLRFAADGRCEELREYWSLEPGRHLPPAGWGR